jgi:hypothetical protein
MSRRAAALGAYGAAHRTARQRALDAMTDGEPCWRCGRPMFRYPPSRALAWMARLDYDHVRAVMFTGAPGGACRLAHARCNRAAGARLTTAIRRAKRARRQAMPARW